MNRVTIKMPLDGATFEQKDALIQKALHILSELLEKSTNATTITIEEDSVVKKRSTGINSIPSPHQENKESCKSSPQIKFKKKKQKGEKKH